MSRWPISVVAMQLVFAMYRNNERRAPCLDCWGEQWLAVLYSWMNWYCSKPDSHCRHLGSGALILRATGFILVNNKHSRWLDWNHGIGSVQVTYSWNCWVHIMWLNISRRSVCSFVLFIRVTFCVSLVCISECSVFCFFWLSCQYLPSDWLERLLWGSLTVARDCLRSAHAEECLTFSV